MVENKSVQQKGLRKENYPLTTGAGRGGGTPTGLAKWWSLPAAWGLHTFKIQNKKTEITKPT